MKKLVILLSDRAPLAIPYNIITEIIHNLGFFEGDGVVYTYCLDFFLPEYLNNFDDVVVKKDSNHCISLRELMSNESAVYTTKHMRLSHNTQNMLKAGSFNWKEC